MESNTSIGIGYVGESYIDFGPIFMFVPIFLLGVFYGLINRFFIAKTQYKLLGSAFGVSVLVFNAYAIESSNAKILGGTLSVALASAVIYRLFASTIMGLLQRSTPRPTPVWAASAKPHP
jgi:hypothetical protein